MPEPTFVWLPGWSTGPELWSREAGRWPDAKHVPVDLGSCETPDAVQERVHRALAEAGPDAVVVGWSLGAMAALESARRLADLAQRLFLVGASGCFTRVDGTGAGWPEAVLRRMRRRIGPETASLLADFDGRLFTDSEREAGALEGWTASVRRALPPDPALAAGLDFLAGFSVSAGEVQARVHLLHGGQDAVCPLEAAVALSEALPHGSLHVVEGAGHAPHWTHPEEVHLWLRSAV